MKGLKKAPGIFNRLYSSAEGVLSGWGRVEGWLFVLASSLAAHFAFSWMGFNPTDEGYTLAVSRRILSGEVPFRDFVAIRPPGSFILHIPWLVIGGDSAIWLSRFGAWLELAAVSWCWVLILERMMGVIWGPGRRIMLAVVSFAVSAHTFPVMAWHSIDAMLASSAGLALCSGAVRGGKQAGYFLLGFAVICRQNFAPLVPATLFILGDWRRAGYWLASALPGLALLAWLAAAGALVPAFQQLTAFTGLGGPGISRYFGSPLFISGIQAGFWGACLVCGCFSSPRRRGGGSSGVSAAGTVLVLLPPLSAIFTFSTVQYFDLNSFMVFGGAVGVMAAVLSADFGGVVAGWTGLYLLASSLFMFFWGNNPALGLAIAALAGAAAWKTFAGHLPKPAGGNGPLRAGILVLLSAWCVSISLGYATPALMNGPLTVFILGFFPLMGPDALRRRRYGEYFGTALKLVSVVALINMWIGRNQVVYRDAPSSGLAVPLDGIMAGARHIRTNSNTAAFLGDLKLAVGKAEGGEYCIIPDLACHWVGSKQPNILPVDWADWAHTSPSGNPSLLDRSTRVILARRGGLLVIVQRVRADPLAHGFRPLWGAREFPLVSFVRKNLRLAGRTKYFDLYR